MGLRAALYARVSSAIQREAQSIESQLRMLPDYVERQGWTLVGRYIDDGRTAKAGHLERRDGLAAALADAAAGRYDVLVLVDLDRLTRSQDLTERGAILGALQRAGVRIAVASTGQLLDLNSSMGDLFSGLQAYFSAEWGRKHSEKVLRGRDLSVSRGRKPAGATPFGYAYDREAGRLTADERAETVREIFRRLVDGQSALSIGLDLERRGVRSPRGGRWGPNVPRIIKLSAYRGEWVVDRARGHKIAVPALVSDDLWFAAQAQLERNSRRGLRRTRAVYLCERILVCGVCGQPVGVHKESAATRGKRGAYYRCRGRRYLEPGKPGCTLPMRQSADIDARVWRALVELLERPDLVQLVGGLSAEAAAWEQDAAGARQGLEELQQAEGAILERFERGLVSSAALDRHLERTTARRAFLRAQLARADQGLAGSQRAASGARAAAEAVRALRDRLGATSPEEQRELVRALVPGWGPHVVRLQADGSLEICAVLRPCAGESDSGQNEQREQGRGVVSIRVVA